VTVVNKVFDVELTPPANALTVKSNNLKFRDDFEKLSMEEVNIDPRGRCGERNFGSISAEDEVKVNKPAALVLRHLQIADFEYRAKLGQRDTLIGCKLITELLDCPIP
jgi:hypothetical protein